MFFPKLSKVAFLLAVMILSSGQIMCSQQGRALTVMRTRHLLLLNSEEAAKGTMAGGTLSADNGQGKGGRGAIGNLEDARPTGPGHSPGAGHAATNDVVGRKLLGAN